MNNFNFTSLEKAISASRLSTYRTLISSTSNTKVIENYIYNAKISENFYMLLQNLEVTLRNAIYDSYDSFGFRRAIFDLRNSNTSNRRNYNREYHSHACWRMIGTVKHHLVQSCITPTDGKIISELNFGFWTKLLEENHYKTILWRQIFRLVFPYYPHSRIIDDDVDIVSDKINNIRQFRNRIFHYEPIINRTNLEQDRNDILEVIGWISPEMQKLSKIYDEYDFLTDEKVRISKLLKGMNSQSLRKSRKFKKLSKKRKRL